MGCTALSKVGLPVMVYSFCLPRLCLFSLTVNDIFHGSLLASLSSLSMVVNGIVRGSSLLFLCQAVFV